jgi:hypothetical protein
LNRSVGNQVPFPRLTLRLPDELGKAARPELCHAYDDATRGAQVQVGAVHRVGPAAERDAPGIDARAVDPEGAQLAFDQRLEPWCGDREQVETIGGRLSR